ncbi:DUF692 domain-containing protein [Novosphingobium sediminicola]|uniref:UPF0276 protein GGR38_004201 n=1 Tax=Novosphingobium sediminicola TaxID=563162 RepID=A0A7W6CJY4_9SPHN|nr:DUF692 domain-containing protein [Novosphingobium sediminicola]MBB3957227.1 hypothetical protein [Novosphingobium sediminicola]
MSFSGPQFGLGLRKPHYQDFLETRVPVDFVEVISENFMVPGGRPRDILRRVRQDYPVAIHGVSMSVGSADGLRVDYLLRLRELIAEIEPFIVSDHLCWTRHGAHNSHDLLPLPYTREALDVVCANVGKAQDVLGREMLIENPSSYIAFADDEMSEWDFLAELTRRTGCGLLLDVNNIHVSATNHGFSSADYLAGIPFASVGQIHLAGHTQGQHCLIDTHDRPVPDPVWALLRDALARAPRAAVMIERDDAIPPLPELLAELAIARDIASQVVVPCA